MLTSCPRRQWRPDAEISRLWAEPASRVHPLPSHARTRHPSLLTTTLKSGWSSFCASPVHEVSPRGVRGAPRCSELPRELGRLAGCARAPSFIHLTCLSSMPPVLWHRFLSAPCCCFAGRRVGRLQQYRRSAGACTAGCWAASGWRRSRSSRRRCCCCCRSWRLLLLRATAPLLLGRLPARLPLPLGPSPAAAAALLEGHCGWRVLCLAGEYIIIIITIIHGDERRSRARGGSLARSPHVGTIRVGTCITI